MASMYVILKTIQRTWGDEGTYEFFPQNDEDIKRATGNTDIRKDFTSNLSCILQLTGNYLPSSCIS